MAIRISGLNSGMDTEAMVQELVKAYSTKTETLKKDQTKAEWKQDAYKALNTKVKSLYTKLGNLQYSTAYSKKTTNVSDTSKVSVITSDNAVSGTQTIEVNKLAKSGYLTGAELKRTDGKAVAADTKLSDLGFTGENTEVKLTRGDGKEVALTFGKDDKISDVVNKLSSSGVNANFDSATGRLFISSKDSGAANDFTLSASTLDGNKALQALGLSTDKNTYDFTQGAERAKLKGADTSQLTLKDISGKGFGNLELKLNGKAVSFRSDMTVDDFLSTLKDNGVDAAVNTETGRMEIYSGSITYSGGGSTGKPVLDSLGILEEDGQLSAATKSFDSGATKIDGEDAEIVLNNATFKSATNNFNINGLTITAKDLTNGKAVSLSTDTDYDGIYDTIKGFIKEYSDLINEMDKLYNAPSAKGYEPLTAEEKEALTEEEVEKWEEKIKDSLLRRDSTVSQLSSIMKNVMSSVYKVNGKDMTLSNFGIGTAGYFTAADNEKNAYHIDGDPDDEATSANADKLKAAIASNPKEVASFFQQLAGSMYEKLRNVSASSSTRSFGFFYDDKKVKKDYEDYEDKISDWEDYVSKIEDKYYKQFSAMETAMSKLNSQQTYMQNMFGM